MREGPCTLSNASGPVVSALDHNYQALVYGQCVCVSSSMTVCHVPWAFERIRLRVINRRPLLGCDLHLFVRVSVCAVVTCALYSRHSDFPND